MRLSISFLFFLMACLLLFLASCSGASTAPTSSPTDEIELTASPMVVEEATSFAEPPPVEYESFSGEGDSMLTFQSDDLPLEFVLLTLGGTQSIVQTSADREFESIKLLSSQSMTEAEAGISAIDVIDDEVIVHIQSPEEWTLEVGRYTNDHFLGVPGGVVGSTSQTVIFDAADAKWLRLQWDHDQSVISIRVFDGGPMLQRFFATSQPYDDWQLLPEDATALHIFADSEWEIQVAQSKPSSG